MEGEDVSAQDLRPGPGAEERNPATLRAAADPRLHLVLQVGRQQTLWGEGEKRGKGEERGTQREE